MFMAWGCLAIGIAGLMFCLIDLVNHSSCQALQKILEPLYWLVHSMV